MNPSALLAFRYNLKHVQDWIYMWIDYFICIATLIRFAPFDILVQKENKIWKCEKRKIFTGMMSLKNKAHIFLIVKKAAQIIFTAANKYTVQN